MGTFKETSSFYFEDSWLEREKDDIDSQTSGVAHGSSKEAALNLEDPQRPLGLVIGTS